MSGWLRVSATALAIGPAAFAAPALVAVGFDASYASAAGTCPNEALRVGTPSAFLPSCRAYEMVSPIYKAGYAATHIEAVAADGGSVAYYSQGNFAGAPTGFSPGLDTVAYMGRRGPSGWSTSSLYVPAPLAPTQQNGAADVSPTLGAVLLQARPGPNYYAESPVDEFLLYSTALPDIAESWQIAATSFEFPESLKVPAEVAYRGASPGFCHIVFQAEAGPLVLPNGELVKEKVNEPMFEIARGCDGEPAELRPLGVENQGKAIFEQEGCPTQLGRTSAGGGFNAIAADGSEIYFSSCVGNTSDRQVFVRLNGERTLEVSKPLSAVECTSIPCPGATTRSPAEFAGAAEDGSRVYFTTAAPLTGESGDTSENLYVASIGCPAAEPACSVAAKIVTGLRKVSRDTRAGGQAGVEGVLRTAPDGSRAYFLATGDLLEELQQTALEGEGRSVPRVGAENLYTYDYESGTLAFVADLCSGEARSGSIEDPACPTGRSGSDLPLLQAAGGEAQTAGADGRYLVFSSYGQLTPDDVDAAKDVYRYDAASGMLERVSLGEAGADANGNGAGDASIQRGHFGGSTVRDIYEMDSRAISEDGSRIVFTTAEPLSPRAVNGLENVYEWHEGQVSLISGGSAEANVFDAVISPDGRNLFFYTSQGLLPQDKDGIADVYDARIGGGFPPPLAEAQACQGEACLEPLSAPAPQLVSGSVSQAAGENFATSARKPAVKEKKGKKKKKRKAKRRGKRKAPGRAGGRIS